MATSGDISVVTTAWKSAPGMEWVGSRMQLNIPQCPGQPSKRMTQPQMLLSADVEDPWSR